MTTLEKKPMKATLVNVDDTLIIGHEILLVKVLRLKDW